MDDKKMKIRVMVQPEETRRAAEAAEREREARVRRSRYGLLALFSIVAAGLIAALVFALSGGDDAPKVAERPALDAASTGEETPASTATAPADQRGDAPLGASLAEARGSGSDGSADNQTAPRPTDQGPVGAPAGASEDAQQEDSTQGSEPAGDLGARRAAMPPPVERQASAPPAAEPSAPPPQAPAPSAPQAPAMAPTPSPAAKGSAQSARTRPSAAVARAQLTSRVVGREPADTLRSPVDVQSGRNVYYYTEFRDLSGHTVVHRWEHDGRVLAAVPFKIGGERWRVYSSKRIRPNQTGSWRVSAVDKNGTVLATAAFVVE